jgi:hypothetical protein
LLRRQEITMAKPSDTAACLLADAGPTVSINTVAKCFGVCRSTAYELAARDQLGVPVLRLGRSLRVPTAAVRRALELDQNGAASA